MQQPASGVRRPNPASTRGRLRSRATIALGIAAMILAASAAPASAADPSNPGRTARIPLPPASNLDAGTVPPTAEPAATPDPAPTADPTPAANGARRTSPPSASRTSPRPSTRTVVVAAAEETRRSDPIATLPSAQDRILIYRESAMVKQYTDYWCVPATTQSMLNLVLGTSDRSYATQERYYAGTRQNNRYTYATKGNDPQGWAWALRYYSGGAATYQDRSFTDKDAALSAIVESIDRTGDPVGVTVHEGTHAWIVLGYKAVPDATAPGGRSITGFYVSGPLGSPKDPWPYAFLPIADFRVEFTRYHEWQRSVIWEGTWVIISQ